MLLLGLGGKPRSGKTVAAEVLRRVHGAKIYSISDMVCAELGVVREDVKDAKILQDHADERRRGRPYYWTSKIHQAIERDRPAIAVIPNIRTIPEVEMVRNYFGHLVRYRRLNLNGSEHVSGDRDMNHHLETGLDLFNWDFHITTKCAQGTLVELQTLALVEYLKNKERSEYDCKEAAFLNAER